MTGSDQTKQARAPTKPIRFAPASKTVAIMQPTYLPWAGYFDLIDQSDLFVLLDTADFSRKSWHHRNRIRGRDGADIWLTIPTHGHRGQPLNEVEIANEHDWQTKHMRAIESAYGISLRYPRAHSLADFTSATIVQISGKIRIDTPIVRSSDLPAGRNDRPGRIADILHATGATELLDTAGARDILDVDNIEGVPIRWHEYEPVPYDQGGLPWKSHLSIIDLIAWCGPDSLDVIKAGRRP